jgi:hypothetical protein
VLGRTRWHRVVHVTRWGDVRTRCGIVLRGDVVDGALNDPTTPCKRCR